jgi:hypothetical protein
MCIKQCLIVYLIYISLMTDVVEHLLQAHWPFEYILWRKMYSNLLSRFKLDCLFIVELNDFFMYY